MIRILRAVLLAASLLAAEGRPDRVAGVVVAASRESRQLSIRTDSGQVYGAQVEENATVLWVEPGDKNLSKAKSVAFSDVAVGDRVLVRGQVSESDRTVLARSLMLMSKASIAASNERVLEDWRARSVAGVVMAVNAAKREITISSRGRGGPRDREWVVSVGANTTSHRYAENSVRYADAKPSSFEALKTGDQLRALGQKDEAQGRIAAEAIVFGTFRTLAGEVISVSVDTGEVTVRDLEAKKPVVIRVSSASMLRRMPPDLLPGPPPQGPAPQAAPPGAPPLGEGPPDLQRTIERLPPMPLAELKRGDAVIVCTTRGADARQVNAAMLVAGVSFLLRASASEVDEVLANWNLDITGVPER